MSRPKTFGERVKTQLRLAPALHQRLAEEAYSRYMPINKLVELAIVDFLDRLVPVEDLRLTYPQVSRQETTE